MNYNVTFLRNNTVHIREANNITKWRWQLSKVSPGSIRSSSSVGNFYSAFAIFFQHLTNHCLRCTYLFETGLTTLYVSSADHG